MIPKTIHYCWFGTNPIPDEVNNQIENWKHYLPDYQFKKWDESNFDVNSNEFTKKMYEQKKWAFVSDYVRLYALINEGGFYLDTDVKVLKNFDPLLNYSAICGFEDINLLSTAVLGCEPHFQLFVDWFDTYKHYNYTSEEPNTIMFTNICKKMGLKLNNTRQKVDNLEVFPTTYFSPKSYRTGEINITKSSYTVHLFGESWRTPLEKRIHSKQARLIRKYGTKKGTKIARFVNLPLRIQNVIRKRGLNGEIKYILNKKRNQK